MGQIKNIKLHIVTDIKITFVDEKEKEKMKAVVVLFFVCLVTANTVMGMSYQKQTFGKDAGIQKNDAVFKKMVRAAKLKAQIKHVQDSLAELAKMSECFGMPGAGGCE